MTAEMLWVEDSDDDALLMEFAAAGSGLEGRWERAVDVGEGIDRARAAVDAGTPHRVVVVDLRLPGGSGLDVVAAVTALGDDADRELVVLTSSSDPVDVERAVALGCTHRQKPLGLDSWRALARHLAELLGPA